MEDFFSQYGRVILIVIVIAILLAIVGSDANSGIAGIINNGLRDIVTQFTGVFNNIIPSN